MVRPMQRCAFFFSVAVALSFASVADAQQLKPYFLVIFDTSGSMTWCSGGNESQYGANDCSCLVNTAGPCGGTGAPLADSAFKKNRCGFPANRLGDAKCALQRIVDATSGEAVFGLMQFEHPCSGSCTGGALSGGGQSCTNGGTSYDDGQLVVGIQSNNTTLLREWVDGTGSCQGTCSSNFTHELYSGIWTPIGKSLQRANEYLRGSPSAGFLYPTNPAGYDVAPASPIANDPQLACRPVSVILLTDGKETCGGNGTAAATTLYGNGDIFGTNVSNRAFRTYVIGFGSSGDSFDPAALNAIAQAGGTDSPDPNNRYFPAANEAQLSVALTQIIADAQPPKEICNDKDDDCDGNADEGIKKFCNKPGGVDDETLCEEVPETKCDNIDDDCDGKIDEGLTNACGTCGDLPKEVCDGVDNDCDQRVDEEASTLEACGSDVGECEKGRLVCVEGNEKCEGATPAGKEICDCKDNDCDGNTDEEAGGDPLCPEDQKCAGCKCQPFCKPVQEFGNVCEAGRAADVQPNGECICVVDNCNSTQCAQQTKELGGDTVCAPNNARVGTCVCQAGECVGRCVGVTCDNDQVCSPKTGECVENNCRGLGCGDGELCDPMTTECVTDKCKNANCADGEVCRAGTCEKSCGGVRCMSGQTCVRGECTENKCAGKACDKDQVCNPADGECITDACSLQLCPKGQACSIESGMCEADPCWDVKCPSGQSCSRGECVVRGQTENEAGSGSEEEPSGRPIGTKRLFVTTGGGGCACSVPGPRERSGSDPRLLTFGLGFACLAALRLRRRRRKTASSASSTRRRRYVLALFTLACLLMLGGCKVSPLCLDAKCTDGGQPIKRNDSGSAGNGAAGEGAGPAEDSGTDSGESDADVDAGMNKADGALPMCKPTGPETCNGKDDDCDFRADEDVTAPANNCLQRGVCAGTAPTCVSGKFTCRYENDWEADETLCDGKDNDCDGRVDEAFPALGMSCELGIGACKVTGTRTCNAAGTGLICSLTEQKTAGEEVCNGIDDDCDGMIDEPKTDPGMNESYVHDDFVQIGGSLWVYTYEASRADATDTKAGILSGRSCSRAGVLPWTDLTFDEAKSACEAAGFSICNVNDWRSACRGPNDDCTWSYTSSGSCPSSYPASNACNGHDVNAAAGSPDTDALKPTGSLTNCYTDFGSAGRVFDLSGNAKEWTSDTMSPNQNPLRGGSYNNAPMGLQCDFDFSVGGPDLHLPNVGFRCCTSVAP
jgi:Sulfatase-modifying factor enzyme 1/Putative metal-binding motif